jgi:hypothetical protein
VKASYIYDHPDRPPPHFYLLAEKRIDANGDRQFLQYHWAGSQWVKGVKGTYAERKIPYQLGALRAALAADPDTEVQLTEGEKDADTLRRLGFVATTNPGGADQWSDDLTAWLRALGVRRIVIHEDNDKAGVKRTTVLAAALAGFATVRVARYPDVPGGKDAVGGEDVTYWIEALGHTRADLEARIAAAAKIVDPELDVWNVGKRLGERKAKPRQWLIYPYFCRTFMSGLVAPGDAGKTTLRLTQAIELAAGRSLLAGRLCGRRRVLFISLEDDDEELQRRIEAICLHHKIDPRELDGWLFCANVSEYKVAELDAKGRHRQAGRLDGMLRQAIERDRYDLIVADPFVKLHALKGNDNDDIDFVCV